jgi:hypothetical protein
LFPEFSCFGEDLAKLLDATQRNAKRIIEDISPLGLHRRQLPSTPELEQVTIPIKPRVRSRAWQEPVELRFDVVRWSHGNQAYIAFVPALGIEVVVKREEELDKRIEAEIRFAPTHGFSVRTSCL